jgi:predicted MFS family arabinose efflux permease
MSRAFAPTALMLGNFATGICIVGPTAMLPELALGLDVGIADAGLLITYGAIVLGIGSPASAWLTSRFDRRALLTATALIIAATNIASALASDYVTLLAIRIVMLAVAALFTPQAAGAAALLAPPERRGSTMSYVFLGWSLVLAAGLPMIATIAGYVGWRWAYGLIGAVALVSAMLLAWRLPRALKGEPVDLATWLKLLRNPLVLILLLITTLQMGGQFIVLTFIGPLLAQFLAAGPGDVALMFSVYGVAGFVGNIVASRIVDSAGAYRTSLFSTTLMAVGVAGWSLCAGHYLATAVAMLLWGLGFAASNSMQQVRLSAAEPAATGASVSLNTSVLYIGQAWGSALGSFLYVRELFGAIGFAGAAVLVTALGLVVMTRKAG